MLDIKEAKCFEFTVKILPPPHELLGGGKNLFALKAYSPPPIFISVYALVSESADSPLPPGLPIVGNGISTICVCV